MSRALVEYRAKRSLYPLLGRPAADRRVMHVCQYKTASQWVQAVLSDPRAYRRHRLRPYAYPEYFDFDRRVLRPLPASGLFLSFYSSHGDVKAVAPGPVDAVVVLREPLKLLVSWYVSTRYTHPPTRLVLERRAILAAYDDLDGLEKMAEWFDEQARIPTSWAAQSEDRVTFLPFEDLVVHKTRASWAALADVLGRPGDGERFCAIGGLYDRIVRLRSNRRLFGGGKYAPTVAIDLKSTRVARIAEDLQARFPEFYAVFARTTGRAAAPAG